MDIQTLERETFERRLKYYEGYGDFFLDEHEELRLTTDISPVYEKAENLSIPFQMSWINVLASKWFKDDNMILKYLDFKTFSEKLPDFGENFRSWFIHFFNKANTKERLNFNTSWGRLEDAPMINNYDMIQRLKSKVIFFTSRLNFELSSLGFGYLFYEDSRNEFYLTFPEHAKDYLFFVTVINKMTKYTTQFNAPFDHKQFNGYFSKCCDRMFAASNFKAFIEKNKKMDIETILKEYFS